MTLWLRDLLDRYEQLSLRERMLVMGALLGLLLLAWDSVLMAPLERERKQRSQAVAGLRAEVSGLEQSTEAIVAQRSADPDQDNRAEVARLRVEISGLDASLQRLTEGLIEPREMSRVLEQMLARMSRVQLRSLRSRPPETVAAPLAGDSDAAAAAIKQGAARIYKHGLELELSGQYLDVLYFLQALEALPWRFFWDRADFTVTEQPEGRFSLTLYTLSLHEGWIGV